VEDFELSLRAWRMGWSCYYEHQAVCRHRTSVTIKSTRKKQFIKTIYNRNKFFLHAIHLQGIFCFLWYIQLTLELIFRLLTGQFFYIKSGIDFIAKIGEVNNSRNRLSELAASQKHKLLNVSQVMSKIRTSLEKKEMRFF
jgi:GT2 family glycosyltransferase